MLPGMMCDARLFAPQIEHLRDRYHILVPLLAGSSSIEGLARQVLASVTEPQFNLLGLSMGGIVAMAATGLARERILRLALLDTNQRGDGPERFAMRNRQIAEVRAGKLRHVIVREMKPSYLAPENRSNQALLDLLVDMAIGLGPEVFIEQSIALRDRGDQSEALRRFRGPSLVLCGAEDTLCPPKGHAEIARLLARASLSRIGGAGHITTLEQPALVNEAIGRWIRKPL